MWWCLNTPSIPMCTLIKRWYILLFLSALANSRVVRWPCLHLYYSQQSHNLHFCGDIGGEISAHATQNCTRKLHLLDLCNLLKTNLCAKIQKKSIYRYLYLSKKKSNRILIQVALNILSLYDCYYINSQSYIWWLIITIELYLS